MSDFQLKPPNSPLTVTDGEQDHYVVEKSEEAGIQDLRRLTQSAEVEERWIHVSGIDARND